MKSILFVATIPGTLSGFLLPFVRHFRTLGYRVDGMAQSISECTKCVPEFDRVWDIEWSRNPLDPKNLLVAAPRIREIVTTESYDLIHVHTPVAAFVTRYALKDRRKKKQSSLIYTAHGFHFHRGGNPLKNLIFLSLEKLAGQWTDYLITINREDETAAKQHQLVPTERVFYTPGIGVDTNYYSPEKISRADIQKARQELGLTEEDVLFLCIAEFTANKRHRDILQALANLNRENIHIAFAGDGSLRLEMEKLAVDLGLQNQTHFVGFRPDVPVLISAATALLLTSKREGLPRSIMEALCLETPVIGTDIRGIRDLLDEGCGLLIQVGDFHGLASAMAWLLDHPQKAIAMGKQGRKKMANYDVKNIISLYEDIYNQAFLEN